MRATACRFALCVTVCLHSCVLTASSKPHIVFIVADDLGFNDVGFRNRHMITPNIDHLAHSGVILNQSYVQPVCSPSRNAFMSGYFPFKTGLQHAVIMPTQATCLPLDLITLPQRLKELGYATHMVGKWHLGFCNWTCTPTFRGFDTFLGYYNAAEDYYKHSIQVPGTGGNMEGFDFRDNTKPVKNDTGIYSTYIFTERAKNIIHEHNAEEPMFLYLPYQNAHVPLEVPDKYSAMYKDIKNEQRRTYCGMVTALDEAIGNVTEALMDKGIYNNTIIIFTADNGGLPIGKAGGNNYPLRAGKATIYEGGTRASAFVHSPLLTKRGYVNNGMMHAVDWYPTIVSMAMGQTVKFKDIDGISMLEMIRDGEPSQRTEFIYNLDDIVMGTAGHAGIRMGDYKLLIGSPGPYDGWFPPPEVTQNYHDEDRKYEFSQPTKTQLFNLKDDPTEKHDISSKYPDIVSKLEARMNEYKKQMVPANYPDGDKNANPSNFGGFWSPGWC